MKYTIPTLFSLACASLSLSHASTFVTYDGSAAASTLSSYVTSSYTATNTGATNVNFTDSYYADALSVGSTMSSSDIYVSFTITATNLGANESIDITSTSFDYNTFQLQDPFFGNVSMYVDSGSGYGAAVVSATGVENPAATTYFSTLTDATTYSLANGESLTFGFSFEDISTSTARFHMIDNFTVEGDVNLVPEPTSAALLGLGGVALLTRRNRRA